MITALLSSVKSKIEKILVEKHKIYVNTHNSWNKYMFRCRTIEIITESSKKDDSNWAKDTTRTTSLMSSTAIAVEKWMCCM